MDSTGPLSPSLVIAKYFSVLLELYMNALVYLVLAVVGVLPFNV